MSTGLLTLAPEHTAAAWLLLAVAGVLVGVAKTAVGGVATIAVAIFAAVLPARASTAALLLVLLVGDVLAVATYHRTCDWRLVRHLLPGVVPGLVLGAVVLAVVDDATLRRAVGVLLLGLLLLQLWLRKDATTAGPGTPPPWTPSARAVTGAGAGFATMVANAAGPVMTLYLLGQRVDKLAFLGTSAWFFLCINLLKLPFSIGLGLVRPSMLVTAALLVPMVLVGGLVGTRLVRRLHQQAFEVAVLAAAAVSAGALLLV